MLTKHLACKASTPQLSWMMLNELQLCCATRKWFGPQTLSAPQRMLSLAGLKMWKTKVYAGESNEERALYTLTYLKSKTKQRMVFRMIHVKDSLLPIGKVWSLDFLGHDEIRRKTRCPKYWKDPSSCRERCCRQLWHLAYKFFWGSQYHLSNWASM